MFLTNVPAVWFYTSPRSDFTWGKGASPFNTLRASGVKKQTYCFLTRGGMLQDLVNLAFGELRISFTDGHIPQPGKACAKAEGGLTTPSGTRRERSFDRVPLVWSFAVLQSVLGGMPRTDVLYGL